MRPPYGTLGATLAKQETVTATTATLVNCPAASRFEAVTLATTLNGAGETSVVINESPSPHLGITGTIKVRRDGGTISSFTYTNLSTKTFTIPSTAFNGTSPNDSATAGNDVLLGVENRLVVVGYSYNAAASTGTSACSLQTTIGNDPILEVLATTAGVSGSKANCWLPLAAGDGLEIVAAANGTFSVTVECIVLPMTTPVLGGGYAYGTP